MGFLLTSSDILRSNFKMSHYQIRGMMRFFVVLAVIGLAVGLLNVLLK